MKNNTMYILGGVALVGIAYYLYNKNKPATQTNSSGFANVTSGIDCSGKKCPQGYTPVARYYPNSGSWGCSCVAIISEVK